MVIGLGLHSLRLFSREVGRKQDREKEKKRSRVGYKIKF